MKKIYLSGKDKDRYCLVDDDDYNVLSKHKWYLSRKGYAIRNRKYRNGIKDSLPIQMHKMVTKTSNDLTVDHINCNKLDNRKQNLRLISNTENIRRRGAQRNSGTGYKGVYLSKNKELAKNTIRYNVYIRVNKKLIFVGYFKDKDEAALAYNKAAKKYHGEYAYQNIICCKE